MSGNRGWRAGPRISSQPGARALRKQIRTRSVFPGRRLTLAPLCPHRMVQRHGVGVPGLPRPDPASREDRASCSWGPRGLRCLAFIGGQRPCGQASPSSQRRTDPKGWVFPGFSFLYILFSENHSVWSLLAVVSRCRRDSSPRAWALSPRPPGLDAVRWPAQPHQGAVGAHGAAAIHPCPCGEAPASAVGTREQAPLPTSSLGLDFAPRPASGDEHLRAQLGLRLSLPPQALSRGPGSWKALGGGQDNPAAGAGRARRGTAGTAPGTIRGSGSLPPPSLLPIAQAVSPAASDKHTSTTAGAGHCRGPCQARCPGQSPGHCPSQTHAWFLYAVSGGDPRLLGPKNGGGHPFLRVVLMLGSGHRTIPDPVPQREDAWLLAAKPEPGAGSAPPGHVRAWDPVRRWPDEGTRPPQVSITVSLRGR